MRVPFYPPGRPAAATTAPTLVQIATNDDVTPFAKALQVARRIPQSKVLTHDCNHFEPNLDRTASHSPTTSSTSPEKMCPTGRETTGTVSATRSASTITRPLPTQRRQLGIHHMTRYHLDGRTVAITGSTGGLGAALAQALRARGANLVLLDVDETQVAAQAETLGGPIVAFSARVDVRDLTSLEAAMALAATHFGRIDVVIANAGVAPVGTLETLDPAEFNRAVDVNLNGVWRTFRAGLPYVEKQHGVLLAISSMAAFVHSPLQSPYTASKAGVWAMCDTIRLELRHRGVAVGSVHPTFFPTPMLAAAHDDAAARLLWGGNTGGLFKMITLELVVEETVTGIERRAKTIIVPRRNTLIAKTPGIFRPLIERLGFKDSIIAQASALSRDSALSKAKP